MKVAAVFVAKVCVWVYVLEISGSCVRRVSTNSLAIIVYINKPSIIIFYLIDAYIINNHNKGTY